MSQGTRSDPDAEKAPPEAPAPIINITGERVCLGPVTREHMRLRARWDNDFEVMTLGSFSIGPHTMEAIEERYERRSKDDPHGVRFTVYERATLRPIGDAGLRNISHRHRVAEFYIMIGERDAWGKGYGTEVTQLVLSYGFTVLDLHNIMLGTFSFNERAIRAYKRAGFREFGRRRQSLRVGGKLHDMVYMDCLATEFESILPQLLPASQDR
jgi:RimJ/RimL family protein N-acetyltransferase